VQGRMGRTAALPPRPSGRTSGKPQFLDLRLLRLLRDPPLWSFQKFASCGIATPGSTSLNGTFVGA
jgi:hypothetical protein